MSKRSKKRTTKSSLLALAPAEVPPTFRDELLQHELEDVTNETTAYFQDDSSTTGDARLVRPFGSSNRGSSIHLTESAPIGGAYAVIHHPNQQITPLVVEGRPIQAGLTAFQQQELIKLRRKRRIWIATILLWLIVCAVFLSVIAVINQRSSTSNKSTRSEADVTKSETLFPSSTPSTSQPSFLPSSVPSSSYPSTMPSTGAPTTSAFDSIVEQLDLTESVASAPESPQFRAIEWMANVDTLPPTLQRYIIVMFYYATGGEQWLNQLGFLNATSHECSNWFAASEDGTYWKGALCWNDGTVGSLVFGMYRHLIMTIERNLSN